MRLFAVLALLTLAAPASAEDAQPRPASKADFLKMCEIAPCRRNVDFSLKKADGTYFTFKVPLAPPVVEPGFISVYPGETLNFEADENPDSTLTLRLVPTVAHPEKTITMKLVQEPKIGDGTGMIFTINNPFDRDIRYHLGIMSLNDERVLATSACPIMRKIMGVEHWPYPLFRVLVARVGFMKPDESRTCSN